MRRPLAWLLGGAAVFEALKRRRVVRSRSAQASDPRADVLRAKLAEARSIVEERDEFEAAETPVDRVEPPSEAPDRRRHEVHEAGREAAARMREQR